MRGRIGGSFANFPTCPSRVFKGERGKATFPLKNSFGPSSLMLQSEVNLSAHLYK